MKVKFTKLAALLLAGVALFATGCTDYEVDIQRNADAIANANSQIAALQATIATLETAANHQADVDKLNKVLNINVCTDLWDYQPVSEVTLVNFIKQILSSGRIVI